VGDINKNAIIANNGFQMVSIDAASLIDFINAQQESVSGSNTPI
jgi:hypothetical protein